MRRRMKMQDGGDAYDSSKPNPDCYSLARPKSSNMTEHAIFKKTSGCKECPRKHARSSCPGARDAGTKNVSLPMNSGSPVFSLRVVLVSFLLLSCSAALEL